MRTCIRTPVRGYRNGSYDASGDCWIHDGYKICQPMNSVRLAVFSGCIVGMIFCGVFLNQLFAMSGMSTICILLFVMFSFAAESFFRYLSILVEDVRLLVKRMRGDISKEELIHKLEGEELDR